jgi:hypothetical protein
VQRSRRQVLDLLAEQDCATARELATELDWSIPKTGMTLLRARRIGLVRRCGGGGYRLSRRGHLRLAWLADQERDGDG